MSDDGRYDFVIFGATGYTGAFVIEQMVKMCKNHTWAVAGRSEAKLKQTLHDLSQKIGISLENVPLIVADVSDLESISRMARGARVILNSVGPFRWYGEPVVKACIDNGTSCVDISGEPQYLEKMVLQYNEAARNAGVYIIGSCSWNAIPCEIGIQYAMKMFHGQLDSVETVSDIYMPKGHRIHYATYQTIVEIMAHQDELNDIRRALAAQPLPKSVHPLAKRGSLFKHEGVNGWCAPFMGADEAIIERTMQYNYKFRHWRPIQVITYMKAPNLSMGVGFTVWSKLFPPLTNSESCKSVLLKHPKLFSAGMFAHGGPSQEQIDATTFRTWIFGNGWRGRKLSADEQPEDKPTDKIVCAVDGPEPGYVATAICMVASAFTVLEDKEQMPDTGGVLSPGAAFADTKIQERLSRFGISFQKLD